MKPFVSVVSGTNRGVGLAIAEAIAAKPTAQVLYAGSRAGNELPLQKGSPETVIHYVKLDIADISSIDRLTDRIRQENGGVDRLINNAGVNLNHDKGLSAEAKAAQTLETNYRGTLQMCQTFIPLVKDNARIINISSVASHLRPFGSVRADRFRSCRSIADVDALADEFQFYSRQKGHRQETWPDPYSVSKACINAMTKVLARENPAVLINSCCPGWCDSDMGQIIGRAPKTSVEGARIPLHLVFDDIKGISGEFWEEPSVSSKGEGRVTRW